MPAADGLRYLPSRVDQARTDRSHGPSNRLSLSLLESLATCLLPPDGSTQPARLTQQQSKPVSGRTGTAAVLNQETESQMTKPKPDSLPSGTPARSSCACRKQPKTLTNPFCDRLFEDKRLDARQTARTSFQDSRILATFCSSPRVVATVVALTPISGWIQVAALT